MDISKFKTKQEDFWFGDFGLDYINRNNSNTLLASNLNFFSKVLASSNKITSCIELGANIGMNLRALNLLLPGLQSYGIEINKTAAEHLEKLIGSNNVFTGSIFDYEVTKTVDLSFTKGVLIHIDPSSLASVYQKLYQASHRYILICEYYNPNPVTIPYRGHNDYLFKRDFCGEMLALFPDLHLIDYGFVYKQDPNFPQDDITWFLMEKR